MEPDAKLATELVGLSDRDAYLRAAGELLMALFPSEHAAWNDVDTRARKSDVRAYPEHAGVDIPKMLLELYAVHPVVMSFHRAPGDHLRRLSDLVSDRQLYRTRAFREGLSFLEVNRQLVFMTSPAGGHQFRGWSMNRWGHDFNDNEVELARHVQPMLCLLEQSYRDGTEQPGQTPGEQYNLTAREQEILRLLSKGLTGIAIGHLLGVSSRTVTKHLEHSYAKLGCTNRIDALRLLRGE